MKQQLYGAMLLLAFGITACSKTDVKDDLTLPNDGNVSGSVFLASNKSHEPVPIPAPDNHKIVYYAFDATPTGNPIVNLPLTNFANEANEVVLFEGTPWEIADPEHYGSPDSYILNVNPNYRTYKSIMNDVRKLQARGVKVLFNIDDRSSWNTTTPFTTYDGRLLDYHQFAAFVKACVMDSLHLDGIALDVEHMGLTPANLNFINLVKEFGRYFGPLSSNPNTTIYTAAIYDGASAGSAIGQNPDVAQYLNFVMDMGYFSDNTTRFYEWGAVIGASKTMIGLSKQYNDVSSSTEAAAWQPALGRKAGIMVFAGNVDSAYTNTIFRALK